MSARREALSLYRRFIRTRHQFPNKKGRSALRRWAGLYFRIRQGEYQRLVASAGKARAGEAASIWRADALQDLSTY